MSQKSEQIAQLFRQSKNRLAATNEVNLAQKGTLDEGFRRMRDDLGEFIPVFCEELNQEPEIGNILTWSVAGDAWAVTRQDTGDALTINFDEALHKAIFSCNKPVKFREAIEVRVINITGWWFATKDGSSAGAGDASVSWVAEKAIKALLGIAV